MKDPFGYVRTRLVASAAVALIAVGAVLSGWPDGNLWPHILVVPLASACVLFLAPYVAAIVVSVFFNPVALVEAACMLVSAVRTTKNQAQPGTQADGPASGGPAA